MTSTVFTTKPFLTGNKQMIALPENLAFPAEMELNIRREGGRIIIEPKEETMEKLAGLLIEVGKYHSGFRPEFEAEERN